MKYEKIREIKTPRNLMKTGFWESELERRNLL